MPYEPTSDDIDRLLADDPDAGERIPPQHGVRVHLEVPLDAATLQLLQARADHEGRSLTEVVSDAVRAGAHAA